MKCYAVSTKDKNIILTKSQLGEFLATNPIGYKCLKCNSFEEAEIALHKIQNRKQKKIKKTVHGHGDEYIMFYDSEFNCSDNKNAIQEIVSMGAVICNKEGKEISRFYSTVKPIKTPRLTKRCKDLTGLNQVQIDSSESLYWVCKRFCEWYEEYNVISIYTLGKSDALQLKRSSTFHKNNSYIMKLANAMTDVRLELEKTTDKAIASFSLSNLKSICGFSNQVNHNALIDAIDLKNVYFVLTSNKYDESAVQKIIDERLDKQKYNQARNVRSERIQAPMEVIEARNKVVEYLASNNKCLEKAVLHAIIDDLNDLLISNH